MASEDQNSRGKKARNYYVDYTKGKHGFRDRKHDISPGSRNSRYRDTPELSFGNRGFLITSIEEVKSYLEMRSIFEGYFEEIYQPQNNDVALSTTGSTTEDQLEAELKQLRKMRPFKQVKTFCRNSLFINIDKEFDVDPIIIVDKFFNDMGEKREMRSRSTFKVLPILDTFRNSSACAKESITNIINGRFKDELGERKFFIEFQSRGNYKLGPEDKQKMIEGVADTISTIRPNWKVDRESADFIIVLVALRNVCCITILRDYFKRFKYNVMEFCKAFTPIHANDGISAKLAGDIDGGDCQTER